MRRRLYIMVKEPRPGKVKTRLGREIGHVAAAWWFRHQLARLFRKLSKDARWQTILAVAPDTAISSPVWPEGIRRVAQGRGNLGQRMARVFRNANHGPVIIIGADIPDIRAADIEEAFRLLGHHDAVLGPAPDGGYWLVGLAHGGLRTPPGIFDGVRWSSAHAFHDTCASLPAGFRVALASTRADVDTESDLKSATRGVQT
ncbi:TIGR04282 family arsenosugar biosynthesis glycosyltransferase [Algicella marina]|uniref:DUF2064 domain-containing protein n=1 Tax=Algicella marina TaxID=2683284 RepID=A0A6P1T2U7_9RHOB|nr:TIGR04282 family arsenosugar biosynthesis glycosyltransferase [Algicella marina]QHQ36075.1 DUF2064 domain-containing protein [Algicella marina]